MATARTLRAEHELRAVIAPPEEAVLDKLASRLNELTRQFIERSPFVCVATARPDGGLDDPASERDYRAAVCARIDWE